MPTYQYTCTSCGTHLEAVQKFTDDPLTECASCGGALRKVFSAVGIVFKGSGFYRNDSRKGSSVNGTSAKPKETAPASETKSGESSSATPAAKSTDTSASSSGSSASGSSKDSSAGAKVA